MNAYYTAYCITLAITTFGSSLGATDSGSAVVRDWPAARPCEGHIQDMPQVYVRRASVGSETQGADAVEEKVLDASGAEDARALTVDQIEIHSGFVIFEGCYIPPPYIVQSEQDRVYINGLEVPQMHQPQCYGRGMGMRRMSQTPRKQAATWIEQDLRRDAMLICTQSGSTAFVQVHQAISILDILFGDKPQDAKVQTLLQVGPSWIASDQWALLVETFDGTAELSDRVLALKQRLTELSENDADDERHWVFLSGITVTGFILAVWALGTLLSCRPPVTQGWRDKDPSRASCRQVIWLVVLIVVLNIYDLTCTLFAHGVGGLWELNPFASCLMEFTSMIVMFKLALTIGATILFLVTRHRRLTQIGSWWVGVLYTVLILRWTTFNTIFL